ncbi:MAG TPA: DUF1343 domain-containing protein [Chitinophagales bacterium]|nr:DUF1343 domain-containing protein [Chitinophagales bacterium]
MKKSNIFIACFLMVVIASCNAQQTGKPAHGDDHIVCGADRISDLLPLLKDKRVALLVNQTSMVGDVHLVDTLNSLGVNIKKVFAPEHGFRGDADAGDHVKDSVDARTKVKIASLYGDKKKPTAADLKDVDVVIFDIQDVGVRFFTFISSLHYLMEACAENGKELIVLDRPNPNGWYIDGPVMQKQFQSFVGLDAIPVVHGLTVGEYAQMVNGEKWLTKGAQCNLKVVTCQNYNHGMKYSLPVKPSPNLPNDIAIYNYPSVCFFEGTDVSLGRGTDWPFQVAGAPGITVRNFSFTPKSKPGAKNPPHLNQVCFGWDLRRVNYTKPGIDLSYLLNAYKAFPDTAKFFLATGFFEKLAGTAELRKQITAGKTEAEIKATWKPELDAYRIMRKKYLLYKDFE